MIPLSDDEDEPEEEVKEPGLLEKQSDLKEGKCMECGKANALVAKQHEGTIVCSQCGIVAVRDMID